MFRGLQKASSLGSRSLVVKAAASVACAVPSVSAAAPMRLLSSALRARAAAPSFVSAAALPSFSGLSSSLSAVVTAAVSAAPARRFSSETDTMTLPVSHMRNVAVIAHVDHGKTTLVDSLLAASGTTLGQGEVRLMDSNTLERERGITILAKNTSIIYNRPDAPEEKFQVNIVDTPGHADFGGEVERIMTMVDGVCLIVDATEGPMAQTKFVLRKALAQGLRPIVVINKVDRPSARVGEVENEIFDLFVALDASDEQLEYPVLYASGRAGWATRSDAEHGTDMHPLFDAILSHIEPPKVDRSAPFKMLVTQIESDNYFGKCLIGRITAGSVRPGDAIKALDEEGKDLEATKVLKVLRRRGMNRFIVEEAHAGDIISLAGFDTATVNSTLCHPSVTEHIPSIPIDPPTLSMTFVVNDSPLNGQEGTTLTSNALRLRLQREAENNVSIRLHPGASKEQIEVHARGEMQLGVIIETMRREGSEMAVCPPQVVFDVDENGALLEPVEEVTLDVDEPMSGSCIEKLSKRGGEMKEFTAIGDGRVRLVFHIPTRGFLGYRSEFTNDTRGQGVINTVFLEYVKYKAEIDRNDKGALIAMEDGTATAYSLESAEARGTLFIEPGAKVYGGMVIGENSRNEDIELNVSKAKQLSNVRSVMKEDKVRLTPPRRMTLEEMISYCRDDEMIEITPKSLRLRKRYLNPIARKTAAKSPRVVATAGLRVAHKANLNFK